MNEDFDAGEIYEGEIVGWHADRGYGFAHVRGKRDIYVSRYQLANAAELRRGDRVRFEARLDRQGRWFADGCTLLEN